MLSAETKTFATKLFRNGIAMMITAFNLEASLNFQSWYSSFLHNIHQTNDFFLKVAS